MLCCCVTSCNTRRKYLLVKENIRNEALRSIFEENLDIIELLKVIRLVQQTYTDKDAIMDEIESFEKRQSPSTLIYSCINLLNFGRTQSRQPAESVSVNEGGQEPNNKRTMFFGEE